MIRNSLLALAVVVAAACGGGDSGAPTGLTGQNGSTSAHGSMTATVNGSAWNTVSVTSAAYQNSILSMAGFDGNTLIVVTVRATGPGTISIANLNTTGSSGIISNGAGQGWGTYFNGGSGTVVVTTLTANRATGTFVFDAVPAAGSATGTMHVTNGKFDVTF